MGEWHFLLSNFIGLMVIILILWRISVRLQDVSFIDAFWAFGMVLLAWASAFQTHGSRERTGLLLFLVTLWGLRLALHLFARWRASGKDPRYVAILGRAMEKKGWSFSRASLLLVSSFRRRCFSSFVCPPNLGWLRLSRGLSGGRAGLVLRSRSRG